MASERRVPIFGRLELVITWDPDNAAGPAGSGTGAAQVMGGFIARLKGSPRPLLERWGQIIRRSYRLNFEAGGRPTSWRALAPATVARKKSALAAGAIPRRTPTGRIPRRLTQVSDATGQREYSPYTKLIESGALRDSWCVKGARGNVADVAETKDGGTIFAGSQLTTQRTVAPGRPIRPYHILTKKAMASRRRGAATSAEVPLARIHEEGAPAAHIPPRPVAHLGDGSPNVTGDDYDAIRAATLAWAFGTGG